MDGRSLDKLLINYRYQIVLLLTGTLLLGYGIYRDNSNSVDAVQIIQSEELYESTSNTIIVEIAGAVASPGVYEIESGARINDLIVKAGGLDGENSDWVERFINKASVLKDGQKIIIPSEDNQSTIESDSNIVVDQGYVLGDGDTQSKYVNINTATKAELESLWGIGPVYAQNIIEHRPYSSVAELESRSIIKSNVYERNKDLLTVY